MKAPAGAGPSLLSELRGEQLRRRTAGLPLAKRLDPVLARVVRRWALLLYLLLFAVVLGAWRLGAFDPEVLRRLPDHRRLTNVRDDLAERPLLAAEIHRRRLYLSQAGSEIHRFDPETELWSSRRVLGGHPAGIGDLVGLRSGCGADPHTRRRDCAAPEDLWGRSRGGGLVRRSRAGEWSVLVGESAFTTSGGPRPSTDDLSSAALSADGRWLLVGTRENGVGLYDTAVRAWVDVAPRALGLLPSRRVTHVRWWDNRFWIGGPEGLGYLVPGTDGGRGGAPEGFDAAVLDLDAAEALWVLLERPCDNNSSQSCLRLSRFDDAGAPRHLVDEARRYSRLDLAGLRYARMQRVPATSPGEVEDDALVLAGRAGLYTYDTRSHTWNRHLSRPVTAAWSSPEGDFFVGYADGARLVRRGRVHYEWPLRDQRVKRLAAGAGREALALTAAGRVFSLVEGEQARVVFPSSSTRYPPEAFFDALELDDQVLLRSAGGVLVHDVRARSYDDVDRLRLPDWLVDTATRLVPSGNALFALPPPDGGLQPVLATDPEALLAARYDELGAVATPVRSAEDWDGDGLGLVDGDGGVYRVTRRRIETLVGRPAPELERLVWRDALFADGELAVASDRGLRVYRLAERAWDGWRLEGTALRRLARAPGGELRALTADGELVRTDADEPFLIGGGPAARISEEGLADAVDEGGRLYLAGDGWVQRYDPARRRITREWRLRGAETGSHRLLAVLGAGEEAEPLSLAGGQVYVGEFRLDEKAGTVETLSVGERYLWTVRNLGGRRYLKGYLRSRPFDGATTRCLFRHATTGGGRLTGVERIRPGWSAVGTSRGLKLYSRHARSWYDTGRLPDGGDLYRLGDYLVLDSGAGGEGRLDFVNAAALTEPAGCSDEARYPLDPVASFDVRATAVDEGAGRVAWIARDGSLEVWSGARSSTRLAAPAGAPATGELRRVFRFGDELYFTTDRVLYRYSLADHRWSVVHRAAETVDMNLEATGGQRILTVSDGAGNVFVGRLDTPDGLRLGRILASRRERSGGSGISAGELLDVQRRTDGRWTFVLGDRLEIYHPRAHRWETPVPLGAADPTLELHTALGKYVVLAEGGRELRIDQSAGGAPARFARYRRGDEASWAFDENGDIHRLRADGSVEKCSARGGEYRCAEISPAGWPIDEDRVDAAYSVAPLILFMGPDGTRAYHRGRRREIALPPQIAEITGVVQAVRAADASWLLDEDGRLFRRGDDGRWQQPSRGGTKHLVVDEDGLLWAETEAGRRRRWTPRGLSDVALAADRRWLAPIEDQPVSAVGSDGGLYRYRRGAFELLGRLPRELGPGDAKGLIDLGAAGWWLHHGSFLIELSGINADNTGTAGNTGTVGNTGTADNTVPPLLEIARLDLGEAGSVLTTTRNLDPSRVKLATSSGRSYDLRLDGGRWTLEESAGAVRPASELADRWSDLRRHVAARPDGRTAYDPVTALEVERRADRPDLLIARRPSDRGPTASPQVLARADAVTETRRPAALDVSWLAWDRERRVFDVRTPAGRRTFSPKAFLAGGRMPFEDVRAVLARPGLLYAATPAGLLRIPSTTPDLNQAGITFRPLPLGDTIAVAHGRFLTPSFSLPVDGDVPETTPYREHRVRIGRHVVLSEAVGERTVAGTIATPGAELPAFDDRGFRWDRRRDLAYENAAPLPTLLTGAGIHGVDLEQTDFDLGPGGRAHRTGRLRTAADGSLHFEDGGGAAIRLDGGWHRAPAGDEQLLADGDWTWDRRGGRIDVYSSSDPLGRFALRTGAGGLGFTSDRLVAASAHGGELFVLSEAYLEIDSEGRFVTTGTGGRKPPDRGRALERLPVDGVRLDSLASDPAAPPELYLFRGNTFSRWDSASETFAAPSADPDRNPRRRRWLVRNQRWRFQKSGNRVVKELRVSDPRSSGEAWKRFTLSRQGFSFDQVRAIGAFDGQFLVHTRAGLQVYPAAGGTGLEDMTAFLDLGGAAARLGRPAEDPGRFVVLSASGCLEGGPGGVLVECSAPASLDERWLGEDDLWRWTESGGQVRGVYLDGRGRRTATRVELRDGRMPHDDLAQVLACGGTGLAVWRNGWISIHPGGGLALDGAEHRDDLAGSSRRLICQKRPYPLKPPRRESVAAGLYATTDSADRWWRWDGAAWGPIADREAVDVLRRPPLGFWGRLRLIRTSGRRGLVFQYRRRDGDWIDLAWHDSGRLAVDVVEDLQTLDGRVWAVTPAGLVSFERGGGGEMRHDPAELTLVREPLVGSQPCSITDYEAIDGRAFVRCGHDSAKVFTGTLVTDRDQGVFEPAAADPFVEREMISGADSGYWDWRLVGRRDGHPGTLTAQLYDEPLSLTAGRFDFDDLTSLALVGDAREPGKVDLASASGGWYRPSGDLWVADLRRPTATGGVAPAEVSRVTVAGHGADRALCLETRSGDAYRLKGTDAGSVGACPDHLAHDGFWHYERLADRLRIRTPGRSGGWAYREMRQGRFTDQVVLGFPAAGTDETGIYHLVATEAGAVRFDRLGTPGAVHAWPGRDAEPGAAPAAVYKDRTHGFVYATEEGVFRLDSGQRVSSEKFEVPDGARVTALEDGPGSLVRLRWSRDGETGWSLLEGDDYALALGESLLLFNAATWSRFIRGRVAWGDPSSWLGLRITPNNLHLQTSDGTRSVDRPWDGSRPVAAVLRDRSLFVVEADEVREYRLDLELDRLFQSRFIADR